MFLEMFFGDLRKTTCPNQWNPHSQLAITGLGVYTGQLSFVLSGPARTHQIVFWTGEFCVLGL